MSYELKTKATGQSVEEFLNGVTPQQQADSQVLIKIMEEATGCPATMWGPSIIGFDHYHYEYASGQSGDMALIGFSPRKGKMVLYIMDGYEDYGPQLARLGKHSIGKSCLYINKLADVNLDVLTDIIHRSVKSTRQRYPKTKS